MVLLVLLTIRNGINEGKPIQLVTIFLLL